MRYKCLVLDHDDTVVNSTATIHFPSFVDYLKEAAGIVGTKKLMWGTDAPFAATQDTYEHLTDYLELSGGFSAEELADIYYNNAFEVYFA